jgi:predicted ATPase
MADGITRIAVEGFKSISKKQSIDIAPLTILAGANSSGKSSIMQPLLMLKQTLDATYDPGPLKIDGPNVRFTSMDQFLSRIEAEAQNKLLSLEIGIGRNDFCVTFSKTSTSAVEIVEEGFREDGRSILIRPKMSSEEIQSLVRFGGRGTFEIERYRFFLYASDQGSPPTTFPGMH